MSDELTNEIETWLSSNWDPDLTVAEWWERLAEARWAVPTWPEDSFGRELSRGDAPSSARRSPTPAPWVRPEESA